MKYLRIYLKQPSPAWLEFTLRDIQVFMKKTDEQQDLLSSSKSMYGNEAKTNPFDAFRGAIKSNLKNMKKEKEYV